MSTLPKILNKHFNRLRELDNKYIGKVVLEVVETDMTRDMLIGGTAARILAKDVINKVNDGSYNFKKALLIRVARVVDALEFKFQETKSMAIDKDGTMYPIVHRSIIDEKEAKETTKVWFNDPDTYQDYIILKGSGKKIDNNSTDLLELKSQIKLQIKVINPEYIDLYVTLLFIANKNTVAEDLEGFRARLEEVGKETKLAMGLVYNNYRKLDSNTRNYPLNRYGFAVEYGDAFEKWLIEPTQKYLVTQEEIDLALDYLKDEFGCKVPVALYYKSKVIVEDNLEILKKYNKGLKAEFSITQKELGKHLHIIDVYENIIENKGAWVSTCVGYDFTNSGGINAANQFGDKVFLGAANLLGGEEQFDTHQKTADAIGISRAAAKVVFQGPNHGGAIGEGMLKTVNSLGGKILSLKELREMVVGIFGENYKYIHMIAQYGELLAEKGVQQVELVRPDGVKAIWYPYVLDCKVSMEDGTSISASMPYGGNGNNKKLGLAVSTLHSSDAFTENYITSGLQKMGIHIKSTLDCFYGRPSIKEHVKRLTFESLNILTGYIEKQLKSIEIQTGISREGGWTLPERELPIVESYNVY